ncbi:normocyte binding protein 2b, partial [Francisella tularensis subsp. holarctica]|nr:normocyte binding protein 2b [Francisella tularensis subsp. holarctica]
KKTKDMNFIVKTELNDDTAVININSTSNLKLEHKYINI